MKKAPKFYVVEWSTESSDRGVLGYFTKKPTDGHLTALFKDLMPGEFDSTDKGREYRLVFWTVHTLTELSLPTPIKSVPSI